MLANETIAGVSTISFVENGEVRYAGYRLSELVEVSSFEETAFLLLHRRLPSSSDLQSFRSFLDTSRSIPRELETFISGLPKIGLVLDSLRTSVSYLSFLDLGPRLDSADALLTRGLRVLAIFPSIVAQIDALTASRPFVALRNAQSSVAREFLYSLRGREAEAFEVKALDRAMILYADNEFNISTFCARMAASTGADLIACLVSALGAFQGPLHGGANQFVAEMLTRVDSLAHVPEFLNEALASKQKIWGIGHLIYKEGDPRSPLMKKIADQLSSAKKDRRWFEMSETIEVEMLRRKGLRPNIDFYAATVFALLGISTELFPAVFAMSRLPGWIAHSLEQMGNSKILMPRAEYKGVLGANYVELALRE